jgi:hypothetical protein
MIVILNINNNNIKLQIDYRCLLVSTEQHQRIEIQAYILKIKPVIGESVHILI